MIRMKYLSRWGAWYLRIRLWFGLRFVRQPAPLQPQLPPPVYNIGFGQTLKLEATFNEIYALDFVREHTSIPVPKVYGSWWQPKYVQKTPAGEIYDCTCFLLMSRIPGITLGSAWPIMTSLDKAHVVKDLCEYIQQMRKVVPPPDCINRISSLTGKAVRDPGLTIWEAVGPFTILEFVEFLMNTWIEDRISKEGRFRNILLHKVSEAGVFLTHADLHFNNIMVHKPKKSSTYRVSGIVDWATAGWYPIYWEAFNARKHEPRFKDWNKVIPFFAGSFPEEIDVLRELHSTELR